jgi:hypothetical protein
MVINLASLPQETIEKYDLNELAQDTKVYIKIQKGMYGLPQAGILANELLLNYSHSRNPRARPHGRTDEPKRPKSHPTKECARARVRCLIIEPHYYYCPIALVMS